MFIRGEYGRVAITAMTRLSSLISVRIANAVIREVGLQLGKVRKRTTTNCEEFVALRQGQFRESNIENVLPT